MCDGRAYRDTVRPASYRFHQSSRTLRTASVSPHPSLGSATPANACIRDILWFSPEESLGFPEKFFFNCDTYVDFDAVPPLQFFDDTPDDDFLRQCSIHRSLNQRWMTSGLLRMPRVQFYDPGSFRLPVKSYIPDKNSTRLRLSLFLRLPLWYQIFLQNTNKQTKTARICSSASCSYLTISVFLVVSILDSSSP